MHRGCAHLDCGVGFDACRIHHVRWWWKQRGRTDIDNLLPLCENHHHLVHEGGWQLSMTPDRIATWRRPDGTLFHQGTTIDRRPTDPPNRASIGERASAGSADRSCDRSPIERPAGSGRAEQPGPTPAARSVHESEGDQLTPI
jgi:hypothetical protein